MTASKATILDRLATAKRLRKIARLLAGCYHVGTFDTSAEDFLRRVADAIARKEKFGGQ